MAKFDWNKFEEVKTTSTKKDSGFDWDQFEEVADEPKQEISKTESTARGAAQGASLGFADEISGGAEALWEKAKGNPVEFGKLYEQYRNESRENFKKAKEENPKSYTTGEIGGGIASAFVPGMAAAKGAGLLSVAGRAALAGGAAGAGYSESDTPLGVGVDSLVGAGIGGTLGGVAGAAAPVIGKGIEKLSDKARAGATFFSKKALGTQKSQLNKMGDARANTAAEYALDNDFFKTFNTAKDMASKNEAVKKAAMDERKLIYNQIDEAGASTFNPLKVATKIEEKLLEGKNRNHNDVKEVMDALEPHLENILSRGEGEISMAEAQKLVEALGKNAKFDASRSTVKNDTAKKVYQTARELLNESADESATLLNKPGLKETIQKANKTYSTGSDASTLLKNRLNREEGNNLLGLTDVIVGTGAGGYGAATGDWEGAGALIVGKKLASKYGAQNAARLLNKVSKGAVNAPMAIEKISKNAAIPQIGRPKPSFQMPKAAETDSPESIEPLPKKGPDKWANDGAEKLKAHSGQSILSDQAVVNELMQSKKGKDLLIQASDLKVGTKAMDKVLEKIKQVYEKGNG